jgi:hypothetical protein
MPLRFRETNMQYNSRKIIIYQGSQVTPSLMIANLSFDHCFGIFLPRFRDIKLQLPHYGNKIQLQEATKETHFFHPSGDVYTKLEWEEEKRYIDLIR